MEFAHGCGSLGLKVANDSTVISTNLATALAIQRGLAQQGVQIRAARNAPDLGIDRGRVSTSKPNHAAIREAAGRRRRRIKKLASGGRAHGRIGAKLGLLGALPQEAYGSNVFGTSPTQRA